jgi:nitrate/TMAO reductase-like tetraheme cytochrome c subunit
VPEWKQSVHYTNEYGVRAGCANCHLPEPFIPKMIRKMQAAGEVYAYLVGTIDTPAKFHAKRADLAKKEWARMRANGAAECKACHVMEDVKVKPLFAEDRASALVVMHESMLKGNEQICSGCHLPQTAQTMPVPKLLISTHDTMRKEKTPDCDDCHKGDKKIAVSQDVHKWALDTKNMICTDCHKGVAHTAP